MPVADFEALLKEQIGLNVESIGPKLIARAVEERQTACQLADLQAYFELVCNQTDELQELVEAVVVAETWFFRDREALTLLARHALEVWLPAHPEGELRLLSLPCATGEEPYSMAMALLDAGFPGHRFAVDGVDISERVVGLARGAVYGKNSFRGGDLEFRDRHFTPAPSGYQLSSAVRARVTFHQGNVLAADFMPGSAIYQAAMCRNLLIYLDQEARRRTIEVLSRLLTPAGLLFVGPSETALIPGDGFASARTPLAFAFHKQTPARRARAPLPEAAARPPIAAPRPRAAVSAATAVAPAAIRPPALDPDAAIATATRLADEGRLREASALCAEHLRQYGPTARALQLMGLLSEAAGKPADAIDWHRKALYLDPDHEETLLHLAFLLHKQGDTTGADRLRGRARRQAEKGGR